MLKTKTLIYIVCFLCVPLSSVSARDCGQSNNSNDLAYKDRGNRCEGIHPQLVGAYDIELISAIANYREVANSLPDFFKLQFCLPNRPRNVHVKVRELEYEHFYWMTDPESSWTKGCGNFFQWSTATVIKKLTGLTMSNLGVLVRLGGKRPSVKEKIAPVIFYHGKLPNNISGYLFTFKTNRDAKLKYSIRSGRTTIFESSGYLRTRGNKPFQVRWDNAPSQSGTYKLILKGFFVSNGESIHQSVRFYHQSKIH
ncbi:MAG: hypothetical protein DRR16_02755 [Candidatus Parabeggiatoa sp. nov. 3]|nr:MAG: hypothetical protein DRR00_05025 [Gammaproteobacteria bacterium]RKZ66079.1 MAG: hypothetical protein DRQ99_10780 [Gammaproteobacteria bacterium]RKZ89291.1 MAG: hypothetical protein DRR16_02755 [Gammaproteobacteria bacterium]